MINMDSIFKNLSYDRFINNPDFYNVIGHVYGDGSVSCQKTLYYNKDLGLINIFKKNLNNLFDNKLTLNILKRKNTDLYYLQCSNRYVSLFLEDYDLNGIYDCNVLCKISFLQALFDDEGSVSKTGIISLGMKDSFIMNLIKSCLKSLNIGYVCYNIYNKKYNKSYYYIRIPKVYNELFYEKISFRQRERLKLFISTKKCCYRKVKIK